MVPSSSRGMLQADHLAWCMLRFGIPIQMSDTTTGVLAHHAVRLQRLSVPLLSQAEKELQKAVKGMEELEAEVSRKKEASRTVKALRADIAAAEVQCLWFHPRFGIDDRDFLGP